MHIVSARSAGCPYLWERMAEHQGKHMEHDVESEKMTITDVRMQRGNETRRSIFIDDEFALGVCEDIYVKYALFKGRVLTQELLGEIRREDERMRCRAAAMRYLAPRMRSTQEVERKLAEKGFSPEAVSATLEFLAGYDLIDDREFAQRFVHDQLLKRPVGRRRLNTELRRKGLAKEEIAATLSEAVGDEDELANALAAAAKKAPTIRHEDPRRWDRAMASFLAGRGFGWDVVKKVLRRYRERRTSGNDEDFQE